MKEYYLIPKEDIDNLEIARVNIWDILYYAHDNIRQRFLDDVSSKIWNITYKKYDTIIK
jgi:hypothetical protein